MDGKINKNQALYFAFKRAIMDSQKDKELLRKKADLWTLTKNSFMNYRPI